MTRVAGSASRRRSGESRAWSRYRGNVARHLIGISRDLQGRVIRVLSDEFRYRGLRPSLGPLLSRVWREGRPLSVLAGELAISQQACSQLVKLAEGAGYLERTPNADDRRSKVVRLTPSGRALVEQGVRIILESEATYADLVGESAYRRFTRSMAALYQGLGIPIHADAALLASAGQSAGVLPLVAVRIQQLLMEAAIARGHAGLKMSHGQVLPLVGPEGRRVHEIARIQRVSRQAIHATARDLEDLGYLRRESDLHDRRGVVLRLTERGALLISDSVAAVDELERSFHALLGEGAFENLQRVARDLYSALHLEEEPPRAVRGNGNEIEQLASELRQRLGRTGAARLAALLEPRAARAAT